ncbi:MAG: TorF family putative porin [Gammaproteobacteria bacterium]|nr:TorF family putative porin [Gammaproteobacteria bacterium]
MKAGKSAFIAIALIGSSVAHAGWSANLGYMSEYHFRGIFQSESSASGGIDYEQNGFYVGTWAADVGNNDGTGGGLEYDLYAGYGADVGDVSLSIGYTGYFYTDDRFDDTYQEINLGAGFGILSIDVALGEYDNSGGSTLDYTYYALTAEHNGFYGTYAGFSQDFDGEYIELGYGTTISDIDVGVALLFSNDDLVGFQTGGEANEAIIFSIGKSFDLN